MAHRGFVKSKDLQRVYTAKVVLDDIDQRLVRELASDARVPNNTLASRAGIAPSTCSLRLQRLREIGAIRGFHADISTEALGLPIQAMIAVRVQPAARVRIGALTGRLAALPGVLNVYFLAGSVDFMIQVAAASPDALREFVTEHLSASREYTSTETSLIFEHVRGQL
ncbi:Lrp/AsnC family transcriptional regulator [Nocardioides sp. KIGAM211]|uniref:Lrp/AsnC family transcriptional regulator n=1 Tax=Nocardioides luti TaxID=2761101 RepID=A0A7X0RFV4_9ACTN|nr:Lrp/AsnC family transcriptional regulator [Nocardioides luti]MBB6627541.1 Lrp/AsnC family transcriptional regulator [Nocardioides luti]